MVREFLPNRRHWALISGLTIAWLAFILSFGSRHGTLSPGWADEVSHLYTTPIFWDHGAAIFREPTEKFLGVLTPAEAPTELASSLGLSSESFSAYPRALEPEKVRPPGPRLELKRSPVFIVTPTVPRPYPPGVYLLFTPVSWLHVHGWLSAPQALNIMIAFGLLVLHLSFFVFYRALRSSLYPAARSQVWIVSLISALAYAECVRWVLNSQYDVVAVALLFAAILLSRSGRRFAGLFIYALALFIHLRALIFAPWAAWTFSRWLREDVGVGGLARLKLKHWLAIAVALAMAGAAGLTLLWNAPYFQRADLQDLNSMHWSRLGPGNLSRILVFATGFAVIIYVWWRRGLGVAIACAVWCIFLLGQSRLMREWYTLFLLPFFLLVLPAQSEKKERLSPATLAATLAFYTLVAAIFMNNSPFEFRLLREMASAIAAER